MPPPPEEFNDRILSPELSEAELQRLHAEVLHIYQTYCLDQSVDKISFDKFIVDEIRNSKTASETSCASSHNFLCLRSARLSLLLLLLHQLLKVPTATW